MLSKGAKWRGGGGAGVMNWEIGIEIYTLLCIKWITKKNLLYKKIYNIKFKKKLLLNLGTGQEYRLRCREWT